MEQIADATWPRMAPQTLCFRISYQKPKSDKKKNCSYICLEIEFSKPKWNLLSSFYGSQINSHL